MGALQDLPGAGVPGVGTVEVDADEDQQGQQDQHEHEQHQHDTQDAEYTPTSFPRFPDLPTELRLKIWQFSFAPRVVEVHRRQSHYADGDRYAGTTTSTAKWQSWSANPPALAVCYESRKLALEHYAATIRLAVNTVCEHAGEARFDLHRRLYLAPHTDTLAVLGEFHVAQTVELLKHIASQAAAAPGPVTKLRPGLRRLALSASSIGHPGSGILLLIYSRTIFQDLDTLTLVLYAERTPPAAWRDGHMALVSCPEDSYHYRFFCAGQGIELRDNRAAPNDAPTSTRGEPQNDTWIKVGHGPLAIMDLAFGRDAEVAAEAAARQPMMTAAEKRLLPVVEMPMRVRPRSLAGADMNDEVPWVSMGP